MVDFAEESGSMTTILSIYLAEYHGKGPADSAAGGAKTKADEAAVYGTTIKQLTTCTYFFMHTTSRYKLSFFIQFLNNNDIKNLNIDKML
jgi:hypothetical protein